MSRPDKSRCFNIGYKQHSFSRRRGQPNVLYVVCLMGLASVASLGREKCDKYRVTTYGGIFTS